MSAVDAAKLGGLLLVASLIQVSLVTPIAVASCSCSSAIPPS